MKEQIHDLMAQVIQKVGVLGIGKESKNKFQNFNYRSIDQVLALFNQIFSELGLFTVHTMDKYEVSVLDQDSKSIFLLQGLLQIKFVAPDGSSHIASIPGCNAGKDPTKLTGQLTSYLTKELFFKQFLVPVQGMDDIDSLDENRVSEIKTNKQSKKTRKGIKWIEPTTVVKDEASCKSWAMTMLPELTDKTYEQLFKSITPVEGKRGKGVMEEVRRRFNET